MGVRGHDRGSAPSHMLRFFRCEFLASYRGKVAIRLANRTPISSIRLLSDGGWVHDQAIAGDDGEQD